jgi:hypothetical protein
MKRTRPRVILVGSGKVEFAIPDADSYQELLAKDRIETIEEIERGLESMKRQRGNWPEISFASSLPRKVPLSANDGIRDRIADPFTPPRPKASPLGSSDSQAYPP